MHPPGRHASSPPRIIRPPTIIRFILFVAITLGITLVAWLIGVFVARDTGAWLTGALAIVIFAVHPNTPMSSGAWVTNDFHKLALLAVLGTLLFAAQWNGVLYVFTLIGATVLGLVAAIMPARRAAHLDPAQAIRL